MPMQQLRWQLLDAQGRVCYQGREDFLPAQIALSLSLPGLVPGIYWLHLQDGMGRRLVEAVYVR